MREVGSYREKKSYQSSEDMYSIQKTFEMIRTRYVISESFIDPMSLFKKLLESASIPETYERMSMHVSMVVGHATFHGEKDMKVASNCTHLVPAFKSAIRKQGRSDSRENRVTHFDKGPFDVSRGKATKYEVWFLPYTAK